MWDLTELTAAVSTAEDVATAAAAVADRDPAWLGFAGRAANTAGVLRDQLDQLITDETRRGIETSLREMEE